VIIIIAFLTLLTWITYFGALNNGFVSDDIEGIANYDGKFLGWDYGRITKYIFFKLFGKDPRRNHIFSVVLHNANVILLYTFLSALINPTIALFTSIIFAVHPVNTQAVAWISGRGYPIGLFCGLLLFNLLHIIGPLQSVSLPIFCGVVALATLFYYVGVHAQFAIMMSFGVLAFLGHYFIAMIGFVLAIVMGMGIVKEVIGMRKKVFVAQNMGATTKLHPKRLIIAFKTLWYYTRLCLLPKRMGLYHVYGYHYNDEFAKEDRAFWQGFLVAIIMVMGLIYGNFTIRLGIVWFISYIFIFLNWITIHQFISERYCHIPVVGICIILAGLLAPYPIVFAVVASLYLMRTLIHLPTYSDEVAFYQSNVWNFPNSEVAFANLGVTYMKRGLLGSAMDMWLVALKINPKYDVAHYNISSTLKTKGQLEDAQKHLKAAVDSPICHFKDVWAKELEQLEHEVEYSKTFKGINTELTKVMGNPQLHDKAKKIYDRLNKLQSFHKDLDKQRSEQVKLFEQQEKELSEKIVQVQGAKEAAKKPVSIEELVQNRDNGMTQIVNSYNELVKGNILNEDTTNRVQPN